MSEEILMNVTPIETRVALLENGVLQEVFVERERSRGIVGNIYLGKVVRVLPGMQAAFVDIGLERTSFIHASDVFDPRSGSRHAENNIRELLREGQSILVQVTKDPLGTKGARLTTFLSIPTRMLVYMPNAEHIGVSQRIDDFAQRDRLKVWLSQTLEQELAEHPLAGGFIVRTAAESIGENDFANDIRYLRRLWRVLQQRADSQSAPSLVYQELSLCERTLRDFVHTELDNIRVDSQPMYDQLMHFAEKFVPELASKLDHYVNDRPIFDLFSVEDEIGKSLARRVDLKSGGYLIIDQTEAMTTIDVNTGGFVGHRNLEETTFKTNLEAATALARHLRVRNLGGIVIIDFIDMHDPEHRRQVLRALEKGVRRDRAKTSVGEFTELGLVQMTRKRTRESLEHTLCEPCTACQGRGTLRSAETICSDIFREILREARAYENEKLLVLASQSVVDRLLDEDSAAVADLEESLDKSIQFQVEPVYSQEQYDVVLL